MSASTEKKLRKTDRENGIDKRSKAAIEAEEASRKYNRKVKIIAAAIVVITALVLFLSSGWLYSGPAAITVGSEKITAGEMNYYYSGQYANFVNSYGQYASMFGLDTSNGAVNLDSQKCTMLGEDATWRDYFIQSAEAGAQQVAAYDAWAKENGIEVSEETKNEIATQLDYIDQIAKLSGAGGVDKYLASYYGSGVNAKTFTKLMERDFLASAAYDAKLESFTYTDEELSAYYAENKDRFDVIDYAYYYIAADKVDVEVTGEDGTTSTKQETTEETMKLAKAQADLVVAAFKGAEGETAVDKLQNAVSTAIATTGASVTYTGAAGSSLSSAYNTWLLDSARAEGDLTVAENAGYGYYVVMFVGRDNNDYNTAQVRHILIKAEASEDGTFSDEAKAAAKAKAEELLAEWKAGAATEESFAELATANSEDTASVSNGGLYENVYKGQMVQEFEDFCFAGHKPGDTAIVYGDNSAYAGYHVMYFVGEGQKYSSYQAENELVANAMSEWSSELLENYPVTEKFALKFVG